MNDKVFKINESLVAANSLEEAEKWFVENVEDNIDNSGILLESDYPEYLLDYDCDGDEVIKIPFMDVFKDAAKSDEPFLLSCNVW